MMTGGDDLVGWFVEAGQDGFVQTSQESGLKLPSHKGPHGTNADC